MNLTQLKSKILKLDKKGYKSYKSLEGKYEINKGFYLHILHAQGDPFASPSKINLIADISCTGFPEDLYNNFPKKMAFQDFILRNFKKFLMRYSKVRGSGKSGLYFVHAGSQEVILRSGCEILNNSLVVRFFCGLPAFGRKINANVAIDMLIKEIPESIKVLKYSNYNKDEIYDFVNLVEDIEFIREKLKERKLIAFIGNGSILPRKSGISELPLDDNPVPFKSPKSMEVEFETLHNGKIKGMGIPEGITLIVGGGFHGKSTLLDAISKGIYPHIRGDGREWVISHPDTVKVRSEDGRVINNVDISTFIKNLPMGKSTINFSTENASGSTSVAANIIETLELGAKVLLLDEDTTATNFLIRDFRIQKLIPKEKEPITPFIDKIRNLYEEHKVSTIIVIGGCGDYLSVADKVISLENYNVYDLTDRAKQIIKKYPYQRENESESFGKINKRNINLKINFKKIKTRNKKEILIDKNLIDLSYIEQILEHNQTKFIAESLKALIKNYSNKKINLKNLLENFYKQFNQLSFKIFSKEPSGDLTYIRNIEIGCAINRTRNINLFVFLNDE